MAKVSPEGAEVNARIVYWGVEGAGKRTTLASVSTKLRPDHRGDMRELPTRFDPSVTYTVLPIELGEIAGMHTRIEMVAVPGAPEHAPTRKLLLDQVDGVVFVADSRSECLDGNVASFEELRKALADYARPIEDVPLVIQYNKRDLADPYAIEELHRRLAVGNAAAFEAVATDGVGLLQTLSTISKKVIRTLREQSLDLEPSPQTHADARPRSEPTRVDAPQHAMEEAILAESSQPDHAAEIEAQVDAAEALLDQPWLHGPEEIEAPGGARIGEGLSIVSVGSASRVDERTVRVPLVVGDAEGQTSSLVLSIRLDPLLDESES